MRSLGQPEVLKAASLAAFVGAIACYPRLALWQERTYPIWYVEALLVLGGTVLWAFVFAWHTKYSGRPVFILKPTWRLIALATVLGMLTVVVLHLWVDPPLRARIPKEYPSNVREWGAMVLFSLAFTQLFLVFAPFAWLLRLFRDRFIAALLTVVFGIAVMAVKYHSAPSPVPPWAVWSVLAWHSAAASLLLYLYLRGGVLLVWYWCLIVQSRQLLALQ